MHEPGFSRGEFVLWRVRGGDMREKDHVVRLLEIIGVEANDL